MHKNRDKILEQLASIRPDFEDHFIPLGGYDDSTDAKREISNLTGTLSNHFAMVSEMVAAAKDYPVYVGYDGMDQGTRTGTYLPNTIVLHQEADESSLSFIKAYIHELTHLDQDRRGLLHEHAVPESLTQLVNYLVHNLALEAAAYANEVVSLYYLSNHSRLRDVEDEVESYFSDYVTSSVGRENLPYHIEEALDGVEIEDFSDLKPAWQAVFQSFFEPDSPFIANYLPEFCQKYLQQLQTLEKQKADKTKDEVITTRLDWAKKDQLNEITTMPVWGQGFSDDALQILSRNMIAAVTQQKHAGLIDLTRKQAEFISPQSMQPIIDLFKGIDGFSLQ